MQSNATVLCKLMFAVAIAVCSTFTPRDAAILKHVRKTATALFVLQSCVQDQATRDWAVQLFGCYGNWERTLVCV